MDKKRRIFEIIQIGNRSDLPSRLFDYALVVCIVLNILMMFLDTFEELTPFFGLFKTIEMVTLAVFLVEYLLRIWTSTYLFPGDPPVRAAFKFIRSFDGIVDLLTILPFVYFSGFVAFRMLRVVRILHLFRLNAQYDSFNVIRSVIYEKRNQLGFSVFIIFILMMSSSICMYGVEHEAQPEIFRNAFSGIWWSVSTVLTVGYGDIYPVTVVGRVMAILIAFLGVGAVAIPTGIISAGFVENYTEMQHSVGSSAISMQTVVVDIDSGWLGKSVEQIRQDYGFIILIARRGNATIVPREEYRIRLQDTLVVYRE